MAGEPAEYHHDLGNGLALDAYAVDPKIDEAGLRAIVESQRGNSRPIVEELRGEIDVVASLDSFRDLRVEAVDKPYQVPGQLKAYRDALGIKSDAEGKFSGPVAVLVGPLGRSLKFSRGGYYDFMATQLERVPADLLLELLAGTAEDLFINRFRHAKGEEERFKTRYSPELIERFRAGTLENFARSRGCSEEETETLREKTIGELLEQSNELVSRVFDIEMGQIRALKDAEYPTGRTVEDLMPEFGITNDQRARYLGFAFIMTPHNGGEIGLVQRAKGMGIAADCISSSGGTPGFPDSDPAEFYGAHIAEEMAEEYKLEKGEFDIRGLHLLDSKRTLPFGAVRIATPLSSRELAKRIYGDEGAIKEHPALYGFRPEAIGAILDNFKMFPDMAFVMDLLERKG